MIHPRIEQFSKEDLCNQARQYLVDLLHKLSMSAAAKDLLLQVPTLLRIIDTDNEYTKNTASHIIFMVETNIKIGRILATNPRHNAYYDPRRLRLAKRIQMDSHADRIDQFEKERKELADHHFVPYLTLDAENAECGFEGCHRKDSH